MQSPTSILLLALEDWAAEQRRLLALEKAAEVDQAVSLLAKSTAEELESLGVAISRTTVLDISTGLFGRTIVKLGDSFSRPLPAHKFTSGDVVGLRSGGRALKLSKSAAVGQSLRALYDYTGVVTAADSRTISIALDEDKGHKGEDDTGPPSVGERLGVDRLGDDVSHNRLLAVLEAVAGMRHGPAAQILRLLFPAGYSTAATPDFHPEVPLPPVQPREGFSLPVPSSAAHPRMAEEDSATTSSVPAFGFTPLHSALNETQLHAISAALRAKDLCMIHGPPGTGKTTTLVEYILQEVGRGRRVLATAPSNVAVDNLLERLAAQSSKLKCVRIGHPARVSAALVQHSLDAQVERNAGAGIVADARKDLYRVQDELRQLGRRERGKRAELRAEERGLRSEVRAREEKIVVETLRGADVVLTTVTGAATKVLRKAILGEGADTRRQHGRDEVSPHAAAGMEGDASGRSARYFDVVVVDEAAQAVELAVLIPACLGSKLIIAGDHQQLPPTVISEEAARHGLSVTLADRFVALYDTHAAPSSAAADSSSSSNSVVTKAVHIPHVVLAKLPPPPPTALPIVHMLTIQYRMHEVLCGWASAALYQGRLVPHPSVARHTIEDLEGVRAAADKVQQDPATGELVVWVRSASVDAVRYAAAASAKESRLLSAVAAAPPPPSVGGSKGRAAAAVKPAVQLMDAQTAAAVEAQGVSPGSTPGLYRDLAVDVQSLRAPLLLVDTAGCDMSDTTDPVTGSTSNVREADVVIKHVLALLAAGLAERQIAVITPYNAQVSLLRAMLGSSHPQVEVRTVDGFQGQEREAIVLSLVRSNAARSVGFLNSNQRINVAVTRAKRHAAIVCDSDTVRADAFLAGLMDYAEAHGQVRSATDYDDTAVGSAAALSGDAAAEAAAGAGEAGKPSRTQGGAKAAGKGAPRDKPQGKGRENTSRAAETLLALARKQLRAFMQAADAVMQANTPLSAWDAALQALPLAQLAATAASAPDLDINLQRELAALGCAHVEVQEGSRLVLRYPAACTPLHRALVHRAATDLGLAHASVGEVTERFICVLWSDRKARAAARRGPVRPGTTSAAGSSGAEDGAGICTAVADGVESAAVEEKERASLVDAESASWTALLSQLSLAEGEGQEEEGDAAAQPSAPSSSVIPSVAAPSMKAVAAPSASPNDGPHADAAPAAKAPGSLLAQLAAERATRAAVAAPPVPCSAAGTDAVLEGLSLKQAGAKKGKKGKGQSAATDTSTGSHPPSSDGLKREFGVLIAPLKPMGVLRTTSADAVAASREAASVSVPGSAAAEAAPAAAPAEKKGKGRSKGRGTAKEEEDDSDLAFLDAVIAQSKTCAVKGCKQSTITTGATCRHCHLRFCYGHGMPEVHGCGDAARTAARSTWVDSGGNLMRSGGESAPTPLTEAKRSALTRKLEKKIDAAAEDRATKQKKSGK